MRSNTSSNRRSDTYDDLVAAYEAMPDGEWRKLGDALLTMMIEGPPASVAFLERVSLDVVSPILEDEPLPGSTDMEEALDAIPSGEFLGLSAVFAEMAENWSEPSAQFLKALGRMFGASMQRSIEARGPLDADTQAFVDVITSFYDE
jgi:hypothetical protein